MELTLIFHVKRNYRKFKTGNINSFMYRNEISECGKTSFDYAIDGSTDLQQSLRGVISNFADLRREC